MPEVLLLEQRVEHLEEGCKDRTADVESLDNRVVGCSDRIYALEYWRNGNGAKGAEARLQGMELAVAGIQHSLDSEQSEENIKRIIKETTQHLTSGVIGGQSDASLKVIAEAAADAVVAHARRRDRTFVSKVKAFAPYFAAALLLVTTILQAVLSR
jgi:hypothetical protein